MVEILTIIDHNVEVIGDTWVECVYLITHRFLYVGFAVVPPEYPTLVRSTPFVAPNKASAPQKQPIPKVAVSNSFSFACAKLGLAINSVCKVE